MPEDPANAAWSTLLETHKSKTPAIVSSPAEVADNVLVQAHEAIKNYFGSGKGVIKSSRSLLFKDELEGSEQLGAVRELVLVGIALRMSEADIEKLVRSYIPDAKLTTSFDKKSYVSIYRRQYRDLIDELYAIVATQVGDVYRYADKIYRIGRIHSVCQAIDRIFSSRIAGGDIDDSTVKVGHLLFKALQMMNSEMGNASLGKMVRYSVRKGDDDKNTTPQTPEEYFREKYGNQLPPGATLAIQNMNEDGNGEPGPPSS